MRPIVALDVDGVIAHYDKPTGIDIGDPIPGAVEFTKRLTEFADIIIHTARCCPELFRPYSADLLRNVVREWLDKHGFAYHEIWIGQGKPHANFYIDDKAVRCPRNPTSEQLNALLAGIKDMHISDNLY
jgi:hypothetical protein